jgi:hypothetical protein
MTSTGAYLPSNAAAAHSFCWQAVFPEADLSFYFFLSKLSYLRGGDLPAAGGWEFRLNGAPECTENDALCLASPAFWCQAPDTGTYDGIWRHFALRFGLSSITGGREMQMYQDGVPLCGLTFSADEQFVPHFPRCATLAGRVAITTLFSSVFFYFSSLARSRGIVILRLRLILSFMFTIHKRQSRAVSVSISVANSVK